MMKYLAVLKDSVREARDSKVLLVLLGLTILIAGFVATFSFKPLTAETTYKHFFSDGHHEPVIFDALNQYSKARALKVMSRASPAALYRLVKIDLLTGDEDSPRSDYALTIEGVVPSDNPEKDKTDIRGIFSQAADLDLIRMGDLEAVSNENSNLPRFRLTIHGTSRTIRIWATEPALFFGAIPLVGVQSPLGSQIFALTFPVMWIGSLVALLAGVIITSFFIPSMLRKGAIDMLLAKPIQRWLLLLSKYVGGLCFMFFSSSFFVGCMWLVLGLRSGLWANEALLMIPILTFYFAILYAISTLVAVMLRSTIPAILLTILAWFLFSVVGIINMFVSVWTLQEEVAATRGEAPQAEQRFRDGAFATTIRVLNTITPRTSDLNKLCNMVLYSGLVTGSIPDFDALADAKIVWWDSLLVSGGWIAFFLTLSCLWFSFKDY